MHIHTYTHTHIHTHTHTHTHTTYLSVSASVFLSVTHTHTHTHIHRHTHIDNTHAHTQTYTETTHMYTHRDNTWKQTHTQAYTQTNTDNTHAHTEITHVKRHVHTKDTHTHTHTHTHTLSHISTWEYLLLFSFRWRGEAQLRRKCNSRPQGQDDGLFLIFSRYLNFCIWQKVCMGNTFAEHHTAILALSLLLCLQRWGNISSFLGEKHLTRLPVREWWHSAFPTSTRVEVDTHNALGENSG